MTNMTKRRWLVPALGLIILFSGLSASAQSRRRRAVKPRVVSAHSVAVKVIDLEALKVALQRNGARPLVVNFWATWCDPCREEFPDLVKIDNQYRAQGLDFMAISLDELVELKTGVPKFLRSMRAKMPAYLLNVSDPEPAIKLVDPNWSGALPATFLFNGKGEVVFKHFGRVNANDLRAAILKVMNNE
jgi:thiol-disulfide isomerase/thioredoxin